ncbi:hypothetical protein CC86DRAFT_463281 [Ophiobolus disseminans]|uniref:2EXR domain-containing protein n=1 Tax=Ophiobolus disseminans TaxID=1469910 RepID=A0A6A7AE04_9PLEO|nr:hypothetical protein CC86DRAFT_463281 [Ophiobolus disseminans]
MDRSRQNSPFLLLPAELRNQIYASALSGEIFDVHCWRRYTPFGFATRVIKKRTNFLSLLSVCRQLYVETRLLPLHFNAFRFKSQDAFHSWFNKFSEDQQAAIKEVHLVTWMARHMVEGEGWISKPLDTAFPVERLPGLKRVEVEVRGNGRVRDCVKDGCLGCDEHGEDVGIEEEKFKKWMTGRVTGAEVNFERVSA